MNPLFSITGKVIYGNQLGRKLGYPTANIGLSDETRYYNLTGVYLSKVDLREKSYFGMANIGFRPSLETPSFIVEVNMFDFDRDIYEEIITIHFLKRLRNELKFDSLEALVNQMAKDETESRKLLLKILNPDPDTK
ncbi:MAG: riboflavin kinase [bacterium]